MKKQSPVVTRFKKHIRQLERDFDQIVHNLKTESLVKADYDAIERELFSAVFDRMKPEVEQL